MKVGDICKCITSFNGELPGEIILQRDDIVQIHKVVDKMWLEGEGGGSIGRFPSSIIIETEVPPHDPGTTLYVAFADFEPMQDGDLRLKRGSFVTFISSVDEDWAYGESWGKKGVFPLNFVWKIDEDAIDVGSTCEQPVSYLGKVLASIRAQLPEELDLYAGDNVIITHIIDDDWYRGECFGKSGIVPKSFVEIVDKNFVKKKPENNVLEKDYECDNFESDNISPVISNLNVDTTECNITTNEENLNKPDPEKLDHNWKNVDSTTYDALLEDDYFKINLPNAGSTSFTQLAKKESTPKDCNSKSEDKLLVSSNSDFNYDGKVDHNILIPIDSLSAKVDEYINNDESSISESVNFINQDLLDIDFNSAYTEDNTGINPYGRAVFSFTAKYGNELSFKKGDIIHLIRHIDSHWTVGKFGILKGIFPTSYIDIIVDCPYKAEDHFEKRSDSSSVRKAIVCFDYVATSPEDVSATEGDIVLITDFVSENWVEIETETGKTGLFPINHLNLFEDGLATKPSLDLIEKSAIITTKRKFDKDDFLSKKKESNIDDILSENLSSLDISCKHSKPLLPKQMIDVVEIEQNENEESIILDCKTINEIILNDAKNEDLITKSEKQEITKLPKVPPRNNIGNFASNGKKSSSLKEIITKAPETEEKLPAKEPVTVRSKSFPQDVSSQNSSSEDHKKVCSATSLNPQRPAPPLPLTPTDSENEEYYSLPSESEESNHQLKEMTNEKLGAAEDTQRTSKKLQLRRESVKELVTTEYEYIHDLESLIHVVRLGRRRKEAASVDLHVLMGNIEQVVELSKKVVKELNLVSYNDDDAMLIGPVFINLAEEMCQVYKVYSSNNNLSVGPLLKKYQEEGESSVFLQWILTELRQHKINLLDMQAVLIKPVQRVLKYPLFIDNLVQNTPTSHQDYKNLQDAKRTMLNVAKEINEYTKRLDLVAKYRHGSSHSFGEMIQRVSMRSVAKKGSRIKTRISATIGLINQTKDLRFEEEEVKFRSVAKSAAAIADQGCKLTEALKGRHKSELGVIDAMLGALLSETKSPLILALKKSCDNINNKIFPIFERQVLRRVIEPSRTLLMMCSSPDHLIQKRYDKLLDFDKAQHKVDKNKDPSRARILEEELKIAQGIYEALNTQLLLDLPKLNEHGTQILIHCMESLISARMNLEGHVTNLYFKLAQIPSFTYVGNDSYLDNFKTKHSELMKSAKKLSFVFPEFSPRSPKFGRRKSSFRSLVKKEEKKKSSVKKVEEESKLLEETYGRTALYITTCDVDAAEEAFQLSLRQGTVVGVIKMKDPSGSSERWFVDDGEQKGFVKSCVLRRLEGSDAASPRTTQRAKRPESLGNEPVRRDLNHFEPRPNTRQETESLPGFEPRPKTRQETESLPEFEPRLNTRQETGSLPEFEPRPNIRQEMESLPDFPPRYEDIFPGHSKEGNVELRKTENLYEEIGEQSPAPSYSRTIEPSGAASRYSNISIDENLDVVSETKASSEKEEPIYETIPTRGVEGPLVESKVLNLPQPDENDLQFYYSLYRFGGDDQNQLPLHEGQVVLLLWAQGSDWWFVENRDGRRGYVPAAYLSKYT